jgi:dTDP-4-dehydrorhamnose reductase
MQPPSSTLALGGEQRQYGLTIRASTTTRRKPNWSVEGGSLQSAAPWKETVSKTNRSAPVRLRKTPVAARRNLNSTYGTEAQMQRIIALGRENAVFENLACWQKRVPHFEQLSDESLASAVERIRTVRPEWVVYCGPAAASSWEERPLFAADEAERLSEIARVANEVDARLALISSDRIYCGPHMFRDEAEPSSDDCVAQSLQSLEQRVLAADGGRRRVLVIRTHAFGWTSAGDSFAERLWEALEDGQPVEVGTHNFATPILATDLAELLLRSLRARLHGVVHLASAERTNPFRFAQELAMAAGFDARLIRVREETDSGPPCETSLGSRLVRRELDVSLPLLRETVGRFVDQATNGYRDRLRSAELLRSRAA